MALSTYQHIDICAGTGMLGVAVNVALKGRLRTVAYIEQNSYAAATLVARMEDEALDIAPIWDDVRTSTGAEFSAFMDNIPKPLCVTAGYPCQPFSVAGKRSGKNDDRYLWPFIAAFIARNEPQLCFFENVGGHLRLGFDTVYNDLERLGYSVAAGLFTASESGASQKRKRLFILGYSEHWQRLAGRACAEWPPGLGHSIPSTTLGVAGGNNTVQYSAPKTIEDIQKENVTSTDEYVHDDMAYTDCQRLERSISEGNRKTNRLTAECGGIPLFAPAPDDAAAWEKIIAINPRVKPAVCRDADGLAHRVDRLRLTGNGVCTLAAAYAFVTLASALVTQTVLDINK